MIVTCAFNRKLIDVKLSTASFYGILYAVATQWVQSLSLNFYSLYLTINLKFVLSYLSFA